MKIFFTVFILSGLLNLSYTQQDLTQIFDSSALSISGKHLEIAINTHPSLIYSAFLIKENFTSKNRYKDAIKLFNIQLNTYKEKKGMFIDSIYGEILSLNLPKLKKNDMRNLFEDYEDTFKSNIPDKEAQSLELKQKLNYDENYEDYYEYCYLSNDYSKVYQSSINYAQLCKEHVRGILKDLLAPQPNFSNMETKEQKKYINDLFANWIYLGYLNESTKPNFINLSQEIFKSDYKTNNKILLDLSFSKLYKMDIEFEPTSLFYRNKKRSFNKPLHKKIFALMGGVRLKLKSEESFFGWIEILVGLGVNRINILLDESSSFNTDYLFEGVGYNFEIGGYETFRKYQIVGYEKSIPVYYSELKTPLYYWNSDLYLSAGVELLYTDMIEFVQVYDEYLIKKVSDNEILFYEKEKVRVFRNVNSEIHISPSLYINYKLTENLTLKFGSSLNNMQFGIITGINF